MLWFERTRHTLCHTQGAERMHLKWTEARHTGRRQRLDINLMAPCSSRMVLRYCMCWPNGSATMLSRHTMLEHCEIRHSIGSTDSVYQLCRMGCPCLAQTMLVIVRSCVPYLLSTTAAWSLYLLRKALSLVQGDVWKPRWNSYFHCSMVIHDWPGMLNTYA